MLRDGQGRVKLEKLKSMKKVALVESEAQPDLQTVKATDAHTKANTHDVKNGTTMSYGFHQSHAGIDDDAVALDLTKRMLTFENRERLSEATIAEYAKSQEFEYKCKVTEDLQRRVVGEFLDDAANTYYRTEDEGLSFLRGHAGNFPSHYEELKECAMYVRQTANCVVGTLRAGSRIDMSTLRAIPLTNPITTTRCSLADVLLREPHKPLCIVAASYT